MTFFIPSLLGVASAGMIALGFFGESWWIGLGFVLLVTSAVVGIGSYGHATALMRPVSPASAREAPPPGFDPETFFPKGAIAFFAGMLIFFAAVWFSMYGLMVHRNGGL